MAREKKVWWWKFTHPELSETLLYHDSFQYWMNQLSNYVFDLFKWDGLPDSVPYRELEKVVMLNAGFGAMIHTKPWYSSVIEGEYWFMKGSESGVTPYDDVYTSFTYGTPKLRGGTVEQNTDKCVVCYNNPLKTSLYDFIRRYAILLAHAEVTACVDLINSRMSDVFTAGSKVTSESIRAYKNAVRLGKTEVIVTEDLGSKILNQAGVPSFLSTERQHLAEDALKAWEMQNEILRSFFRDIGLRFAKDKKERMVEAEVTMDNAVLLINVDLMLQSRQEFCDRLKKYMGLNVTVDHNRKEEIEDERTALQDLRLGTSGEGAGEASSGGSDLETDDEQ